MRCLLHIMHGGRCAPVVENINSRPQAFANGTALDATPPPKTEETTDPYDDKLYDAAKKRFETDLEKYGVTEHLCKQVGCWPPQSAISTSS